MKKNKKKDKWVIVEEEDGVHVRPMKNGKIIDTPVIKRFDYRKTGGLLHRTTDEVEDLGGDLLLTALVIFKS